MNHEDFMKYEEKKGHGTYMLPFAVYGTLIPNKGTFFPAHWHDEIEVIYAREGHCIYYVNFKPYDLYEGEVLIIPPGVIHSFEQSGTERFIGNSSVFSLNMVNNSTVDVCSSKYFMPLFNNEIVLQIHMKNGEEHTENIRKIVEKFQKCYYDKADCYEIQLKIYLLEFFKYLFENKLYENSGKKSSLIKMSDKTKVIITYIEEHFIDKITLEDLAKLTNQSVYNLSHSFKYCTGQSPMEYINQYRLSVAAKKLESTDEPVINIAADTGFNNVSYFNRAFKNKFQMTPTQYRRCGHNI